jgi:predicted NBD/HSP70 family sugar kinase
VLQGRPLYSAPSAVRSSSPADQAAVRRANLGLVLRHLRDEGPRSRARIAQETGLNKATVSSLVADLAQRRLVSDGEVDRAGAVGRPGLTVHLDGHGVAGIGVELNVDYAAAVVLDLSGDVLFEKRIAVDAPALGPEATLDQVARLAAEAVAAIAERGAVAAGLTVAIPGLVQSADGVVIQAPNLGWRNVPLLDGLRTRLDAVLPIHVDNDANLSAIAEWAMGSEARTPDLVYLTGEVGVGGGIIVAGQLIRGARGLSGEVGHMPIGSANFVCGCGRRGCWETTVGLAALLRTATGPDDPVNDPARDLEARLAELSRRAESGDERTLTALQQIGTALGTGAAVLINLFNPAVIVLGGYFAVMGSWLMGPLTAELEARVFAPGVAGTRVVLSTLGFTAAARGGAHVALESVFQDPTVVPAAIPQEGVPG